MQTLPTRTALQLIFEPLLYRQPAFGSSQELMSLIKEMVLGGYVYGASGPPEATFFYPAFFPSVWLWLYAGSGLLISFLRRLNLTHHLNTEQHPLQCIGLVAAAVVAAVYLAAAIVTRL